MAMNVFDATGHPELKTLLDDRLRRRLYWGSKFSELIGGQFLTKMGRADEVSALAPGQKEQFVGAPIETVNGFIQEGRTDMLIPVMSRLKGDPVFGDKALEGTEEGDEYTFRAVQINRTRKAYAKPVGMSYQVIKQWAKQYVRKADTKLTQWWSDYFPSNLLSATLYGFSRELIVPTSGGGRGVTSVSHPNIIVAGSGPVGYGGGRPGTAGYEVSVETALNGLSGAQAEDKMSVAFIRNMVQEAARKRIKPIVSKSGYPLYPIFIKDTQWNQLRVDPEYKAYAQSLLITKMQEHPLAHLGECEIDGALIIVDLKLWTAYTNADNGNVTAGTIGYGPRPTAAQLAKGWKTGSTIDQLDTGTKAVCILIGESALTIATGEEMSFHDNVKDYDNNQGVGIDGIKSVVRNDLIDTLGGAKDMSGNTTVAGDIVENTGSLIGVTYSPFALAYT